MKKIFYGLSAFFILLSLTACKSPEEELDDFVNGNNDTKEEVKTSNIVGSWERNKMVYKFREDGTCYYDMNSEKKDCKYETSGNNITITYTVSGNVYESTYKIEGDKLIFKDSSGEDDIFTRVK